MTGRLNRLLLGLAGVVVLALGLAVLIGGLDLERRWGFSLPRDWPYDHPDDVLLSADARTRYRHHGWWWPAVIAALAAFVLAALCWFLAQLRDRRPRRLHVDRENGVLLRTRALEDAIAAEAETFDGVARAHVHLAGPADAPTARIVLALARHAHPDAVLDALDAAVLTRARVSANLPALPAEARLRAVSHRATKVS